MPDRSPAYRVVVFDVIDDPGPIRALAAGVVGMHPTDAQRWIARMPCISEARFDESQARALLEGLYELGVAAEARREDNFPVLSPVLNPHTIACLPEGFRVTGLRGEPTHWVPWSKVELINAGKVDATDEARVVAPVPWVAAVRNGLNAVLHRRSFASRRERAIALHREPVGEIVLVRNDPIRAFRLCQDALNYSYLKDRLQASAGANFPLLLEDLCQGASEATLTPSTRALRAGDPAAERFRFRSSQALLEDSSLWLLWRWYRQARDENLREMREGEEE